MKRVLLAGLTVLVLWQPVFLWADDANKSTSDPNNFVYLRYGSASVVWVIYQRSLKPKIGSPVFTIGVAPNPHGSYRERFGGMGINFNGRRGGVIPTALYSYTTDGPCFEYWVSPWYDAGHWLFNSFVGGYAPLSERGSRQFFVDPVTLTWKINRRFALGGSYTMIKVEKTKVQQGVGPAFQVKVPGGTVVVDWFKGLYGSFNDLRVTLQLAF